MDENARMYILDELYEIQHAWGSVGVSETMPDDQRSDDRLGRAAQGQE